MARHIDLLPKAIVAALPDCLYHHGHILRLNGFWGRTPARILFFDCTTQSSQVFAKSYGWVHGACAQVLRKPSLRT